MAEALVPKDAFSLNTYFVDGNRLEKQILERSGVNSCYERINNRGNTRKGIEMMVIGTNNSCQGTSKGSSQSNRDFPDGVAGFHKQKHAIDNGRNMCAICSR